MSIEDLKHRYQITRKESKNWKKAGIIPDVPKSVRMVLIGPPGAGKVLKPQI